LFRTFRSRYRRIVPALVGSVAILAAVFLAQSATQSEGEAAPQLAAAERSADGTASRGGERSADGGLALQIATAIQNGEFGSPQDVADATTTTTAAPTTTTTAAPPTTTKAKPVTTAPPATTAKPKSTPIAQKSATPPPAQPAVSGAPNGAICALSPGAWCTLAKCETGDRNANTGNGYYGYFQFDRGTWKANGGPTDYAHQADAATQLAIAKKLQASRGWSPWPSCSKKL
jgi:hypothetical protein